MCLLTSSQPVDYSRFFHREAISLARAGYKVTFIGLGKNAPGKLPPNLKVIGIPGKRRFRKLTMLWKLARLAFEQRTQIYHCFDPWALAIGLGIKTGRPSVRLVYDSTEYFPAVFRERKDLPLPVRLVAYAFVRYLEWSAIRSADGIIETNATRAHRFIARGSKPVLVPNYPPLDLVSEIHTEREPWLVYTGLICRHRGFDVLLKALSLVVRKLPQVKLKVIGKFAPHENIETWTKEFLKNSGLKDSIDFLGWLPSYDAIFSVLQSCSVGVVLFQPDWSNDYANLPTKLFDFMASGLAVIASPFPEISAVVKKTGCGWLVDPTSPESVAIAIEEALSNSTECAARGRAGKKGVIELYNWESAERTLLTLYGRLIQ